MLNTHYWDGLKLRVGLAEATSIQRIASYKYICTCRCVVTRAHRLRHACPSGKNPGENTAA